ncbi:interferon-related developmental regulator 2-like isoform X2 [Paramacrobiotus metropolitanus]|uniref:interferon-related developmental regulator 2-like isoform X2 n=1 Tax=Paramacrobiotus metropolitanus TaxID=2943436 RepID=UPI002445ECF3|nr:interferon-related developmental regulator 2-like isoform X2 [Paramacrobiotus metropolitanus]
MPKGRKKDAGKKPPVSPVADVADDKSDAGTVISSGSDVHTINLDDGIGADGTEDQAYAAGSIDLLEEKLKDAIENATDNSAKSREASLAELCSGFERRLLYDFIAGREDTLADIVERSLHRGKTTEQVLAGRLASLIFVQLGSDCGEFYGKIRNLLLTTHTNASVPAAARSACAEVLSIGSFIADEEPETFSDTLRKLSKTFALSYFKGDKTAPQYPPEVTALHAQSLIAWCLLMSVASESIAVDELNLHLRRLPELLESGDVDLRIAAGEAIALMKEITRDVHMEKAKKPDVVSLCNRLRELATESTKHVAKKDKKQQRSSFRDILHSVEDDDGVFQRVRFGKEVLDLHTWRAKHQYQTFCNVLRTGMNFHLRMNSLIRQVFDLGEPILDDLMFSGSKKADKFHRQLQQSAMEKNRTMSRNMHRGNKQAGNANFDDDE